MRERKDAMHGHSPTRRTALKSGSAAALLGALAAAGWFKPSTASAQSWNKNAFESHELGDARKALGAEAAQSGDIAFVQTPEIAENGAVVPIGVASRIAGTDAIAILIEKNPNPLAAVFDIPPGTEPAISTRVKMAQTSNVYALVRAQGRYYVATKEIKVTLGGCGG
jgi:sulfur-oxidizing protein SoxY